MRLMSLYLKDFRGFAGEHHFDLNAEAVVLIAANGQGKTSFFDSILWCLTGLLPRLGKAPRVLSLYSQSGEARVELKLVAQDGRVLTVVRREPGGLVVACDGDRREEGTSAAALLYSLLWPAAEQAPDGAQALAGALTRSVYLQQDLVRDFVEGDDDKARFAAVSELAGAGRVTELAVELERARLGWSRATNAKDKELTEATQRLATHQGQLASLAPVDSVSEEDLAGRWTEWWPVAIGLEPTVAERQVPTPAGIEAANALEAALLQLGATRRKIERQLIEAESLQGEGDDKSPVTQPPDLSFLRSKVEEAEGRLKIARDALKEAELAAAEQRRKQVERRQAAEELAALAELAIRHIEGHCPVCGQEHEFSKTQARLEAMIEAVGSSQDDEVEDRASSLAAEVQVRERDLSTAQAAIREAEGTEREAEAWKTQRDARLAELGVRVAPGDDLASALLSYISNLRETRDRLDACEASGERLSVDIAGARERARAHELKATIEAEQTEVSQLAETVGDRQRTGELASTILDALREASASVVDAELKRIDPLLQRIYSTADPHPCFRAIRLLSKVSHGRGRLSAAIDDQIATLSVDQPEEILSSSQLNALAVSVFLALNLGLPSVPLPVAMLDDPLQSLDDVNLLGLIDLLRRAKGERQLLLSTHDPRFGGLLARKLRPVGDDGATRVIEIEGWGRGGPTIREVESRRDSQPLRIAA